MRIPHFLSFAALGLLFASCAAYKQNIMFRVPEGAALSQAVSAVESNYLIQPNDVLKLEVFTNQGERIIDPNLESFREAGQPQGEQTTPAYLVDINGVVRFPLIDTIRLAGLTIRQAEAILQKEYTRFYLDPFVLLKFTNKRVTVLGAPGGQVIPLMNENMKLTEVLALAKGLDNTAKSKNIRVLRQDQVYLIDFSTIEGYRSNDMIMQSGDIVYVEPVRRPVSEGLREFGPIISIITSIGTLVIVILQANNR